MLKNGFVRTTYSSLASRMVHETIAQNSRAEGVPKGFVLCSFWVFFAIVLQLKDWLSGGFIFSGKSR